MRYEKKIQNEKWFVRRHSTAKWKSKKGRNNICIQADWFLGENSRTKATPKKKMMENESVNSEKNKQKKRENSPKKLSTFTSHREASGTER